MSGHMPRASSQSKKQTRPTPTAFENPLVPHAKLRQLYVLMLKSRMMAERMVRDAHRRRTDRRVGHEASRVAIALGLRKGDIVVHVPDDHVVPLAAGAPLQAIAQGEPLNARGGVRIVRPLAKDATQFSFACGLAFDLRSQKKNENVVLAFGDEVARDTLSYAAEEKLPIIFVVENSAPVDVAGHASARGVTGFTVDGNDAVGVYRVSQECFDRARRGVGPSFIECKAPGWKGRLRFERAMHRDIHELDDPLLYVEHYLSARGLLTDEWKRSVKAAIARDLQQAFSRNGAQSD
jgi:TPP-dependent pyruvate/acetoin dehydrogenase alpha subunit